MTRFLSTVAFLLVTITAFAQGSISGILVDADTGERIIGANVVIEETNKGVISDLDGTFRITDVVPGTYSVQITYTGYNPMEIQADVADGRNTDLGTIEIGAGVGLEAVNVIASVAVDRRTPIAVTTLSGAEISNVVGNQEFPEVLRNTPSVYVTKEGGGFGDARINVRGFDQSNTAVLINGIPVNDMENGRVFWSNWAGLSDVTSFLQVQRGLGATKLAVPTVGGSINIITDAAKMKEGGAVRVSYGNDGYQKYGMVLNSGLKENGWAYSFQATHTRGDGYVDGTKFRAFSYFGSITNQINDKHSVSMTALGAPQWHHQRSVGRFDGVTLRTYVDPDQTGEERTDLGIRYNHLWGMYQGEEFTWRRNFYHKPKAFVNHYWSLSPQTSLKTSAYVSFGRGGGTGPRGRINGSFDTSDKFKRPISEYDEAGAVRFDDIAAWNSGKSVPDFGDDKQTWFALNTDSIDNRFGQFANANVATSRDGLIRRASINSHNWYGVLSQLTHDFGNGLTLNSGIDFRFYRGIHYRRMDNLLGADAYFTNRDINNAGTFITQERPADLITNVNPGDNQKLNYYNDGLVQWAGLFTQLEYSQDAYTAFISLSGSNQAFKRLDYFNYQLGTESNDEEGTVGFESEWQNLQGGTIKGGMNINLDERNNVFVNGGYFSRQPFFDNVFANFSNQLNEDVQNESIYSVELGYGFRGNDISANLNLYSITWTDRQFQRGGQFDVGGVVIDNGLANFNNVGQRHNGVELELDYRPNSRLNIDAMLSLGDWNYTEDFNATIIDLDTGQPTGAESTLFADGVQIGDAAQTTASIGANYEVATGLRVRASWFYADRLFGSFQIDDSQFFTPPANDEERKGRVAQLPSYSLVDAGLTYNFEVGGSNWTALVNVNNVLNNQYIAELDTNIQDDPATTDRNEFFDNRGFYGFGVTWNTGLRIRF